jgi:hypothetical protein
MLGYKKIIPIIKLEKSSQLRVSDPLGIVMRKTEVGLRIATAPMAATIP